MSHVEVHRLIRPAKRRLGRIVQIEALPPQPARHDGTHWGLGRQPFVHGYYGARSDLRFNKKMPALQAAIEAAIEAGVPAEEAEALTLDELVITPDLLSGSVGGATFETRWPPTSVERPSIEGADSMPGTSGGVITISAQVDAGNVFAQNTSAQIPPMAFITGFSIAIFVNAGINFGIALSAGGIGLYNAHHAAGGGTDPGDGNMINAQCSIYTKSGGPTQMSMSTSAVESWPQSVHASISWVNAVLRSGEPVRR